MKRFFPFAMLLLVSVVNADVPVEYQDEVEHLINFVKNTSCQINRNGEYHIGAKAIAHIQKKYRYFKDDISTTEQFIDYSATKSTMSGKYYMVKCGGQEPEKTRDWLLKELKKYRVHKNR